MGTTYKDAGVDIEAGDALVDWLIESPKNGKTPHQDKIVSGIGGFAALFRASFGHMKSPCLVSSTDGVGTKVKLASDLGMLEGIGQDLVAMCVNDLICVGAEPLFFLDYYATGKLRLDHAKTFLTGVRQACHESGCALIGGETAEMPGVYSGEDFDCAGFAVGVVDEHDTLGSHRVELGDRLVGVSSSGFHSNGYSLVRKVFAKDAEQWAQQLLMPTNLYVKLVLRLRQELKNSLHAVAHVTGGGMDNLLRVVPAELGVELKPWPVPDLFLELKKRAQLPWMEMLKTLNCGVGLVLTVDDSSFEKTVNTVKACGYAAYDLGVIGDRYPGEWKLDFDKLGGLK